jgi:tRNA pseudouridine38-40 synthase
MVVKLTLEYDGTRFSGWQLQPDAPSVQGVLEQAVAIVLREPVRIVAAGRTDAGVHACGQIATFRTAASPDLAALRRSLNALAGPDIAVVAADAVSDTFDPRRDARSRTYAYCILNRRAPSPFWRHRAWHIPYPLDVDAMRAAAEALRGEHDFSSFRGAGCTARHAIRQTLASSLERKGDVVRYEIEATGFVRHMVRNIVGTLVEVGRGALDLAAFLEVIAARERRRAGPMAPACGLYLVRVCY